MRPTIFALFIILLCFDTYVQALKCACMGGSDVSRRACEASGHIYGMTGCGFTGCCMHPNEVGGFANACQGVGSNFLRCDECPSC
ncbi:hypothetical protein BKA57DRAFT_452191 [Linnemannia elongata]|nr:hypothetical protein BKA57DRAFT_452191 [Linnemannia elongata]